MAGTLPVRPLLVYPSITSFSIASPRTAFKLPPNAPRLSCMASFKVTLLTPSGEKIIDVPDDITIAEAAEDEGISIPLSCRSGACSSCAAVLKQGVVDQAFQSFLDEKQLEQGFVLTCVAYPLSDAVLQTHQESLLY